MPYTTETLIDQFLKQKSAFDLGKRFDGRWNIWRQFLVIESIPEDSYWGWEVVGVVSSFKFGTDVIDWCLKNQKFKETEIENYIKEKGYG